MTDEQMNECRQQLATIATARYQLAQVSDWLERHHDIPGKDPYVNPTDLAYQLNRTMEQLAFTMGQCRTRPPTAQPCLVHRKPRSSHPGGSRRHSWSTS